MQAPDHWYAPDRQASPLARALSPLGAAYGFAGRLRQALMRPYVASVPVICIGNLTAGGTGKTPLTQMLAHTFTQTGRHPHILTRGYRGRLKGPVRVDPERHSVAEVGDEALLLAANAPTWVSKDRSAGARAAIADGADLILMDDGLQNQSLAKTITLLCVDGAHGFGNGRLIPAGPLRESVARGLSRVDAIVLMGPESNRTRTQIAAWQGPLFEAHLQPDSAVLSQAAYFAFAGIGQPERFFETLEAAGAKLAGRAAFPDHHPYSESDIATLRARATSEGAQLVTTTKDAARLSRAQRAGIDVLAVRAAVCPAAAFWAFLTERLAIAEPHS